MPGLLQKVKQRLLQLNGFRDLLPIYAPLSGELLDLEAVPDKIFSEKIVGDGVAIQPSYGDTLVAPVDGILRKIFPTHHAFSLVTADGLELLVHFGIDTVQLRGQGFQRLAQETQFVKRGDPIIHFDLPFLQATIQSTITPVVIANRDIIRYLTKQTGTAIAGESVIMQFRY
ncbi:MAG: glucose PTS transporter subunit IIA [Candidatus Symbiodolus clandestinus]